MVDRYAILVDESRVEIDGLSQVLEYENMEINKVSKENEKYMILTSVGQKNRNWGSYEDMLA